MAPLQGHLVPGGLLFHDFVRHLARHEMEGAADENWLTDSDGMNSWMTKMDEENGYEWDGIALKRYLTSHDFEVHRMKHLTEMFMINFQI